MRDNSVFFSLLMVFLFSVGTLFGQSEPDWLDADVRALQYPTSKFMLGFASGSPNFNENLAQATDRIKNSAQSDLLESIRVSMTSNTQSSINSESINGQYFESEQFKNETSKKSIAEIVGMKTESYYEKKSKIVHAFAYANREDVITYHKKKLASDISQVEGLLNTAEKLFVQKDNTSARTQCSEVLHLFVKIYESQSLLLAINNQNAEIDIQQDRVNNLYKSVMELQSKLDPKFEILENLKNQLSQKLLQVESYLATCLNLVNDGEKSKARQQCESAKIMLNDIRLIQDSMRITEPSISIEMLEQKRTEKIYNDVNLLSAQLAQAVMVYIESSENVLGKQVNVITNKLMSEMAAKGCSFTEDVTMADFKLVLTAETRDGSTMNDLVFCYADVSFDLYDIRKQKSVYSDDVSVKGGSVSREKAARKAMENTVNIIMDSIVKWIK